jgi:hypothetical protein
MSEKGKKLEPPMHLDMDFGEALSRFVATKPEEVAASIEKAKTKRPPEEGTSRRPARSTRGEPGSGRNRKPNHD